MRWSWSIDLSELRRPHLIAWADETTSGLGVDWSDGSSDPLWSVAVEIDDAPELVLGLLGRIEDALHARRAARRYGRWRWVSVGR